MHIGATIKTSIMKKVLTIMFVASLALAATSCQKERTCSCTAAGTFLPAQDFPIAAAAKSDQETACTNIETTRKIAAASATCTLN